MLPFVGVLLPPLLNSAECRPSFGCSCIGAGSRDSDLNLEGIHGSGVGVRVLSESRESFAPALAG